MSDESNSVPADEREAYQDGTHESQIVPVPLRQDERDICPGDPEHYMDAHGPGQPWWGTPFSHQGNDGGTAWSEWVIAKHDAKPRWSGPKEWDHIEPAAMPWYTNGLDVVQAAKEKCAEWSYEDDAHGYCHDRSVLVRLVHKIERVQSILDGVPPSTPLQAMSDDQVYDQEQDTTVAEDGYIPSVRDLAERLLRAGMNGDKSEATRIVRSLDRETRDHLRASFDRVVEAIDHEDM